jgi:cytochrome c peroxidase
LRQDRQLITVELPLGLDLISNAEVRLVLDVEKIFAARHRIELAEELSSSHSRAGDALADQLRQNIEQVVYGRERPAFIRSGDSGERRTCSPKGQRRSTEPPLRTPCGCEQRDALSLRHVRFVSAAESSGGQSADGRRCGVGPTFVLRSLLSINNSQSCASCHEPEKAFAESRQFSIGAEGATGTRNAMPLLNLAWKSSFFWDGRAVSLREQVLQPIQNPIEMHETLTNVIAKLRSARNSRREGALTEKFEIRNLKSELEGSLLRSFATEEKSYSELFERAFGTPEIDADRIARALEQFLLTRVSFDSKCDRVLSGTAQFTAAEQRGFELFHTEYDPRREQFGADCFHCHGGPLFQSQAFANNGVDTQFTDSGRFKLTKREGDKGKFAVPSLRNVELTAPYMHDGRFATLEELVEHYSTGVKRSATLDPNLAKHPDGGVPLSSEDKRTLVAFLKTLTDERFRPVEGTRRSLSATR